MWTARCAVEAAVYMGVICVRATRMCRRLWLGRDGRRPDRRMQRVEIEIRLLVAHLGEREPRGARGLGGFCRICDHLEIRFTTSRPRKGVLDGDVVLRLVAMETERDENLIAKTERRVPGAGLVSAR